MIAFPAWLPADIISWLGLGSVGISFAFPDLQILFSGNIVAVARIVSMERWIILEGFEGTVEKILRRSTQIIIDRGERVIMPKALVFTNSVRAS